MLTDKEICKALDITDEEYLGDGVVQFGGSDEGVMVDLKPLLDAQISKFSKPPEELLLTREEITDCVPSTRWTLKYKDVENIVKAQLSKASAYYEAKIEAAKKEGYKLGYRQGQLLERETVLQEIDNTRPRFKRDKNAYSDGWNDCRQEFFKVIDRIRGDCGRRT